MEAVERPGPTFIRPCPYGCGRMTMFRYEDMMGAEERALCPAGHVWGQKSLQAIVGAAKGWVGSL